MITKTELKERGWTDSLVKNFYPRPDETKYKNGKIHYHLYDEDKVSEIESSELFKEAMQKAVKRQDAAKKATNIKRQMNQPKFYALCETINKTELPTFTKRKLYDLSCQDKTASDATKNRWAFNYLRHQFFHYDDQFVETHGMIGKHEHINTIRNMIGQKVTDAYPYLETAVNEYLNART